jgi:phosphoribosylglycinamide formyltransferase-1
MPLKIAVLVSGRGSNLEAILASVQKEQLAVSIEAIVSNKDNIGALDIAKKYGIEPKVIPSAGLSRLEHERLIHQYLEPFAVDYLILAGYTRILTSFLLKQYEDNRGFYRVVNIHPSLLPAFPGKNAYDDAFAYGVKISGITVHLVDEEVDHGTILAQEAFPRLPADTLADFKARGLALEHTLFPKVLQDLAKQHEQSGRVTPSSNWCGVPRPEEIRPQNKQGMR